MVPYSLVNQCSKNMQIIENVLNTSSLRQTMGIWPDPPQTILKANQTLDFTTILKKDRNSLLPEKGRRSTVDVEYYSTRSVLNRPAL